MDNLRILEKDDLMIGFKREDSCLMIQFAQMNSFHVMLFSRKK
jgi:hypothetical protein